MGWSTFSCRQNLKTQEPTSAAYRSLKHTREGEIPTLGGGYFGGQGREGTFLGGQGAQRPSSRDIAIEKCSSLCSVLFLKIKVKMIN